MAADETPSVARIYDYLLGGAHNLEVDRVRAEEIVAAFPNARLAAWANRTFLRHAVEHALHAGVRQFLDLGSGIPTAGNVHEIAHRHAPDARVAYVDNEPIAVTHSRELLADVELATMTDADLRDPDAVLTGPGVADLLDFDRPVALLALGALQYVPDHARAEAILRRYREALAPGSLLALSHSSDDYPDRPDVVTGHGHLVRRYASTTNPLHSRSRAEIRAMIDGAGFVGGELVDIARWAPPQHDGEPLGAYATITGPLTPPA